MNKRAWALVLLVLIMSAFVMGSLVQRVCGPSGPKIDVFSDRGGIGPGTSCDPYYMMEEIVLFANATYNEWLEPQRDVSFQITNASGAILSILYSRTDEFGIAATNFTLPYASGDLFGNWTIVATVSIQGVAVNDTLPFEYLLHEHFVQVASLIPERTVIGQGFQLWINASLFNRSNNTADCYVTVFANDTTIMNQTEFSVALQAFGTMTFAWNTSGFAFGNYTLTAFAEPVQGAICADNPPGLGWSVVSILGDMNVDFQVDVFDALILAASFCSGENGSIRNPNADINNDHIVDLFDALLLASNFGKKVE